MMAILVPSCCSEMYCADAAPWLGSVKHIWKTFSLRDVEMLPSASGWPPMTSVEEPEGVIEASYRDKRYGVLSEVTAVNRAKKLRQTVRNEAFLARGGSCRRVVYVPSRSVNELRYTGRYQIEKSAEDARELTVTLAGSVDAEPMDRVELSLARLGVRGTFRVSETLYTLSASGETTELTLWEV